MKHLIIPTVFATNKKEFNVRFAKLIGITYYLQIDFMDGKFVKGKSVSINDVPDCHDYFGFFEAHLMVINPEKYILELKEKGFKKVIFHIESVKGKKEAERIIKIIKKLKMKAWIALNPPTDIDKILGLLGEVDGVLFMGVKPGKEHQKFIPAVYSKIKKLRSMNKKMIIQVDGGVNLENIGKLRKLGVNYINSGSLLSDSANPRKMLKKMKRAFLL